MINERRGTTTNTTEPTSIMSYLRYLNVGLLVLYLLKANYRLTSDYSGAFAPTTTTAEEVALLSVQPKQQQHHNNNENDWASDFLSNIDFSMASFLLHYCKQVGLSNMQFNMIATPSLRSFTTI